MEAKKGVRVDFTVIASKLVRSAWAWSCNVYLAIRDELWGRQLIRFLFSLFFLVRFDYFMGEIIIFLFIRYLFL